MYTSSWCPFCIRAKQLLDAKGLSYEEISVDGQPQKRAEMMQISGRHTVPQIWVNDHHVGGCDELYQMEHNGQLDKLIKN